MDKNQFNNLYQQEDNGRPLYAQPTAEQDYEETSDGYGNQSIEDDIQNIIIQAQQAYANKQITSEEFQMIQGTQQQQQMISEQYISQQTAKTNGVISPDDNILMPPKTFLSQLGGLTLNHNSSTGSNQLHQIDVHRALNHRKSNQNIMDDGNSIADSKRYIDTNHDKDEVYENNDNLQWTNQLSQIQEEEQPRNYQLRSLENENNYKDMYDFQDHRIDQTVSVGALPPANGTLYENDKGHSTGHFNSRQNKIQLDSEIKQNQPNVFKNQFDGINSPHIGSEYYVMSSQPVTGRRSREGHDSSRPFSSNSRTISQMERNGRYADRQQSPNKSQKSGEGFRQSVRSRSDNSRNSKNNRSSGGRGFEKGMRSSQQSRERQQRQKSNDRGTVTMSNKDTESIPQSIHSETERSSEYQKSGITQMRDQTIFAQQFKSLYSKIQDLYPQFSKLSKPKDIPNLLQSDGVLPAQNIYSQLSFMLEKALEGGNIVQQKQNDRELVNLMKDQAQSNSNMLKHQIENTQRETEYYKKQMDIFKDQMHKANLREQKIESELTFFKNQVQKYEDQIVKIQRTNTELERKTFELKMNKMNDETNNISFRGTHTQQNTTQDNIICNIQNVSSNQPYKSPDHSREIHSSSITKSRVLGGASPHNRIDLSMTTMHAGDNSRMVVQLQGDVKELRSKMKLKEELVGFEKDANQQLNIKIDKMSEEFRQELVQKKKEIEQLRLDNNERIETIRLMNQQLENFTEFTSVEFPLMLGAGAALNNREKSPISGGINLSNQNKNGQKLVSMTKSKSPILAAIDDEMENILQRKPFGNDSDENDLEQQRKVLKNYHMPVGIRNKMNKSPMNGKKQKKQPVNPIVSLFGLGEMVKSQISTISIVDDVMKELQEKRKNNSSIIDKEIENMKQIETNIESLNREKEDFSIAQKALTKENQDLKQKFSDLLDQFQEYVNESETRMEEERVQQKSDQQNLLNELNSTIKELEEMSKQLQGDNMKKEEQIDRIELEKSQLQKDIDFLKDQAKNQDEEAENLLKTQIQSLNEEISYLKKHYMVEMDVLRQENTLLQNKASFDQSHKKKSHLVASQSDLQEEIRSTNQWQTPGQGLVDQNTRRDAHNDIKLSRQKSDMVGGNDYNMPFGRSTFNNEFHNNRRGQREEDFHPDDLDSQQRDSRNVRSSSYDNFIAKSRSSRLSRSRERNERNVSRDGSKRKSNERQPSRAKDLITGAQSTFDGLKRELIDKDRLIESKNREIVKLRLENDEIKSNFEQIESLQVNQHQRTRTYHDLAQVAETLRSELERTKINLFKGESGTSQCNINVQKTKQDKIRPDEVMTCESKMIQCTQELIQDLKNLISLASEIFLLSSKYKYGLGNNSKHSPNKLAGSNGNFSDREYQRLISENENLQRTVYKYEGALAHIESANKNPTQESVSELKRLTNGQVQEILNLQSQLENMERQLMERESGNSQNALQENRVLKTEINLLRENEARNEQLRDGNEELLQERRGLILRIEQMEKETNEGQGNVAEKEKQHEELRSRITVIAELFEKKPISQRYSFEVLCDFIHDKAKRLFNKYENAIKDKKMGNDERGYSNQRKIQMLEQDLASHQEVVSCCKSFVIPRVYSLLNNGNQIQQNEIERQHLSSSVRQLITDVESSFLRMQNEITNQKNQKQYQISSNNSQHVTMNPNITQQNSSSALGIGNNGYSNLVSMRNTPSNINTIKTQNYPNNECIPANQIGISANTSEFEMVKEEKEILNKKLDDFTKILGEFQKNQQTYEQENQNLKSKIGYLESRTENQSLSATTGTVIAQIGRNDRGVLIPQTNNSGLYSLSSQGDRANIHFQNKQSMGTTVGHLENETTGVQSMNEMNNFMGYQQTNC